MFGQSNNVGASSKKIDFYQEYKPIRNKLRKYNRDSVIYLCTTKLHEISTRPLSDAHGWLPWNLLLLIKWALLECSEFNHRPVQESNLIDLLNQIHDLHGKNVRFLNSGETVKWFRAAAYQQFWLQKRLVGSDFARQLILFSEMSPRFGNMFRDQVGLCCESFIELLFLSWLQMQAKPDEFVDTGNLALIYSQYGAVDAFLKTLSRNPSAMTIYLRENYPGKLSNPAFELVEKSPLWRWPFLQYKEGYLCCAPQLFAECGRSVVYHLLKRQYPSEFGSHFGEVFEAYVARILEDSDVSFYCEREIQAKIGNREKRADFLIEEGHALVALECKGVEISSIAATNSKNQILRNALKESLLKGITQAFQTAKDWNDSEDIAQFEEFYFVIITYRSLLLGVPEDAWAEFIQESIKAELISMGDFHHFICPSRLFFVDIEEFETLMAISKNNQIPVSYILRRAAQANRDPASKKFSFGMHLSEYEHENLKILGDKYETFASKMCDMLSRVENSKDKGMIC